MPSAARRIESWALRSVSRALLEMWLELTVSSSIAAAIAAVASDWRSAAPATSTETREMWSALSASWLAPSLISPTIRRRARIIVDRASSMLPSRVAPTSVVRSPSAAWRITAVARSGSPPSRAVRRS